MIGAFTQRLGKWLAIAAMLGFGLAFAQSEPTLNQVYEAAQSGKMDQAQTMIQQVLVAHPNSGKAHFVQAELFAKQGLNGRAGDMLATAEKLSPGLPFAKAEAVQSLRAKISARPVQQSSGNGNSASRPLSSYAGPAASTSNFSWGMPLLLAGGVMLIGYFVFRRKNPPVEFHAQPPYANPANPSSQTFMGSPAGNGLSGPQTFGMGGAPAVAPVYGQPQASGGIGRNLAGGLATGLAVGAGMMAAQAIGKSLMGNNEGSHDGSSRLANNNSNNYEPIADNNSNMGGQNFGVADNGSWDDGGSADAGGGDWDS
jgi:hypothetical protein